MVAPWSWWWKDRGGCLKCRIDPTFCPTPQRLPWETFFALKHKYPDYLNYPLLPNVDRFITHHYFVSTLKYAIRIYEGVPDLACKMLVKIAHLLLLIVDTFNNKLSHNRPWEIFLEGNQSLTFDLNKGPSRNQIMGFYARCQFLPWGFIKSGLQVFGPNVKNPT